MSLRYNEIVFPPIPGFKLTVELTEDFRVRGVYEEIVVNIKAERGQDDSGPDEPIVVTE